ncbi:MAG: pilus assembly protein [Firmicutes bacterium]|nr:pilus assembly protein [Bacillota bacterium]
MKEKGTALVEAAIVIPLLLLLLIGLVEMGLLVNSKLLANEAARAAAREFIRTEDEKTARDKAEYLVNLEDFKLTRKSDLVTTETEIMFDSLLPGVWKLFSGENGGMTVKGIATFHLEPS